MGAACMEMVLGGNEFPAVSGCCGYCGDQAVLLTYWFVCCYVIVTEKL
jgi:hypothetical protein